MYTREGLLARSTGGRLLADRDQSIAAAIKRMTRINDFHLFAGGYVIVILMGISRRLRSMALTGGCHNRPGGRRRLVDRWDLNRPQDRQSGQGQRIVILSSAMGADDSLPDDVTTLKAMLRAERAARLMVEAEAQSQTLLIEKLKLTIKKLRHEQFGQSSERGGLLDQLELQLADLEENVAQAETTAQMAAADKITVPSFERRKPARRPLPEH